MHKDCMFPYKHCDAGLIEDVVDGVISEDDIETEDYPIERTIKHWKWWMQLNEESVEGQIRSAAHRFLDYGHGFLKSAGSLLKGLKERISPGWMKAAVLNPARRQPFAAPAFVRCPLDIHA